MYLPLLGQRAEEKMIVVHKIEMRPTKDQANFLKRCCGVRRFIYNACLAEWKYAYSHGLAPDEDYIRFYLKLLCRSGSLGSRKSQAEFITQRSKV